MYWEDLGKACSLHWGAVISQGLEAEVYISSTNAGLVMCPFSQPPGPRTRDDHERGVPR